MAANWTSSTSSKGGTPGRKNSVLNKKAIPQLLITYSKLFDYQLKIAFNFEYTYLQQIISDDLEVDKNRGSPQSIQWNLTQDTLLAIFNSKFEDNESYTLRIKPVETCAHTIAILEENLFKQSDLKQQDVLISEILFNPKEGGADFVEIYNNTVFPVNIKNWKLGNRIIIDEQHLLPAHEYLALTTSKAIVVLQYPSAVINNIMQVQSMPPYPNQQGNVTLYTADNNRIDSVYYNANMHDPLLVDVKGISLERQSLDPTNTWFEKFQSSATWMDGATPGYENATNVDYLVKKNIFFLTSKTMSPNEDSYEDSLEIQYQLKHQDYVLNLSIYNDKGTLINRLIRNQRAGYNGKISWNGENENGHKVAAGYYIVLADIHRNKGDKERFKIAFVVVPNTLTY